MRPLYRIGVTAIVAFAVTCLSLSSALASKTVVLVRHAEKQANAGKDPALTDAGKKRAGALVDVLSEAGITHVFTTQYQRTQATAKPTAMAHGVKLTVLNASGEIDTHFKEVAAAVAGLADGAVVLIVGHSNTIPHIVTALGGPKLPDMDDTDHTTLFLVTINDDGAAKTIRATYGDPNP